MWRKNPIRKNPIRKNPIRKNPIRKNPIRKNPMRKNWSKVLRILALVGISAMLSVMALPIPANAIADPDSPPNVNYAIAYSFADGSVGVLVGYFLDYAITPSETVDESYVVVFVDIDGTTQLKSVSPYPYVTSGYGRGVAWVYFTAAEVTLYSLDSTDAALYKIWLTGNPAVASGWAGDPPKTIANLDEWKTAGDMNVLLSQAVLGEANALELAWGAPYDLVGATPLGNRLTYTGQDYFTNAIPNLRTYASSCFLDTSAQPVITDLDYTTEYGAIAEDGTDATVAGSPYSITEGGDTITVALGAPTGTIVITLSRGTSGTIANDTGTIPVSPSDLVFGENVVTVTGAGDFTVTCVLTNLQTSLDDSIIGTGWDLTALAASFSMSRSMFSTLVWVMVSALAALGLFLAGRKGQMDFGNMGATKAASLIFGVVMIAGTLMGLVDANVTAAMVICAGAYIGYTLFYKTGTGDIGRTVQFMGFMFFITTIAGGLVQGIVPQASATLSTAITAADTTITVDSTTGFPSPGRIDIEGETIYYYDTTAQTFIGSTFKPLTRGDNASAHSAGVLVRQPETSLLNNAMDYDIALLSDASGIMAFITVPLALFDLFVTLIKLPVTFIGTSSVYITVLWGIFGLGLIVSIFIALAGGRRV